MERNIELNKYTNKNKNLKKLNKCRNSWATIEQQRETEILSNKKYF